MNVRFGIIFLIVAMVFAIGQVSSEEAEAETMVRREASPTYAAAVNKAYTPGKRSADPLDAKKFLAELKKRLGRAADPGKISMSQLMQMIKSRQGRKAERSADPDPDPGMLDLMKNIPFIGKFL